MLHAGLTGSLAELPTPGARVPAAQLPASIFIQPRVVPPGTRVRATAPRLPIPASVGSSIRIDLRDADRPVVVASGVGTMPPRPLPPSVGTSELALGAGLGPGEGDTVVFRVRVLGSGAIDQVVVEVSGRSAAIDHAAEAYLRLLQWDGGTVDGRPVAMWIRWGVRLQASETTRAGLGDES